METQRIHQLRIERTNRVPEEPSCSLNDVISVNVRDIDMGLVSRHFPSTGTVSFVYDWIGSLKMTYRNTFVYAECPEKKSVQVNQSAQFTNARSSWRQRSDPYFFHLVAKYAFKALVEWPIKHYMHESLCDPVNSPEVHDEENINDKCSTSYETLFLKRILAKNLLQSPSVEAYQVRRDSVFVDLLRYYRDGIVDITEKDNTNSSGVRMQFI